MGKLIIKGNSVYEIDDTCMKKKVSSHFNEKDVNTKKENRTACRRKNRKNTGNQK